MYDLLMVAHVDVLLVSNSRNGAPVLLEVVAQQTNVRFVAGVLVAKWCRRTKMYDLLIVSWSRNAPAKRCTIC